MAAKPIKSDTKSARNKNPRKDCLDTEDSQARQEKDVAEYQVRRRYPGGRINENDGWMKVQREAFEDTTDTGFTEKGWERRKLYIKAQPNLDTPELEGFRPMVEQYIQHYQDLRETHRVGFHDEWKKKIKEGQAMLDLINQYSKQH